MSEPDFFTCRVTWSLEDKEYVGRCAEFPSLSWLDELPQSPFHGIRDVVAAVVAELKTCDARSR